MAAILTRRILTCCVPLLTCWVFAHAQKVIPVGGNTFTNANESMHVLIDSTGISKWKSKADSFVTYLRVNDTGDLKLAVEAASYPEATISVGIGQQSRLLKIAGNIPKYYDAGVFQVKDTGYLKIVLKGISRAGNQFPVVKNFMVIGHAVEGQTNFVKNNAGNFFYWGRRGPSVHLNYPVPDTIEVAYFYNEITVPAGEDKIGSYFMATGFGEGYFGIQVNSPSERRVLFSVWSPFDTDDPKSIPDSLRIHLLQKGAGVQTGEFGNEGSGGQSFLRYNWKSGVTYGFMINAKPGQQHHTIYTAWIFLPEKKEWQLLASFDRPNTSTSLKRLHSFLENFLPETGDQHRKAYFGNQWICDRSGHWSALSHARFTADNTAKMGYRADYGGGVETNRFYLENCGFFKQYTTINKEFTRSISGKVPESVYLLSKYSQ